ncbi:hypothetical protein CC1G_06104 [Coprinopsis cinerea okayama7|uniref:Uncharacterized protein n=1 Tax=Coprinopsis cinerea (strain Okayama-7 / 130 / ATCC MYA-4618 / FGSC 9003) TaxID=240176 RepID=A8PA65_COPC7|nr:hypothetical protein CC1G_06104 [Coprinopsis cinerea okayama7\|eukprot:XP_001839914.2 hypothetical protein CC1G_06104 [Coprinopsis cinerea okayama7\
MPASYKHPRSEPKARRVSLRTTGRSLMPSRGGAAKPLRHERTWSGPNPSLSSTPSNNPFYIPPSDTAPSTPVAADIEAFKQSFPKLPSGGRENQDEVTPTPLTRQHAVIIHGKPLGAERRTGSHVELRSTGAKAEASIVQSSPISIKIESSPTQLELILKGVLPIFSSPVDETQNVSNTHSTTARAGTRTSPTAKSSSQPSSSKRPLDSASDHQSRKARRTSRAGSSTRNPIEELVLQWAQEALEEEEAVTGEDLFHLPPFSRLPPPPQQTRYNLRDRARVVKQETVFAGRTEQDYVDIRPAFFRKAAIKTFNPARLPCSYNAKAALIIITPSALSSIHAARRQCRPRSTGRSSTTSVSTSLDIVVGAYLKND